MLHMAYKGPYKVISQLKNGVECRHLCMKNIQTFHVERLKLFSGTREVGKKVAMLDFDQHFVDRVLYYRGNPSVRETMEFFVRFADGEERWVTWSKDLFETVQYEEFCRALFPHLHHC